MIKRLQWQTNSERLVCVIACCVWLVLLYCCG